MSVCNQLIRSTRLGDPCVGRCDVYQRELGDEWAQRDSSLPIRVSRPRWGARVAWLGLYTEWSIMCRVGR